MSFKKYKKNDKIFEQFRKQKRPISPIRKVLKMPNLAHYICEKKNWYDHLINDFFFKI